MIISLAELKSRFATAGKPSQKDFSDLIDTLVSNTVTDAHIISLFPAPSGDIGLIARPTAPTAAEGATSVWLQTLDAFNVTSNRIFTYRPVAIGGDGDGNWHSRNPVPPGTIVVVTDLVKLGISTIDNSSIFSAVAAAMTTYDGGGSPGTGAMWEIATELYGKFPLGVDNGATVFPFSIAGGEISHTLVLNELPSHTHTLHTNGWQSGGGAGGAGTTFESTLQRAFGSTDNAGAGFPHNNMPPYYPCYFLRRTVRTDYIIAPSV
jgi:microcystin-dependent protein